jgi:hypothetical protein
VSWLGLLGLAACLAALGFLYAYPRLREPPLVKRDFVGRVLDKSLTLGESQTGTTHRTRLLVKAADGRQFEVAVTPEQYEGARAGMWVARTGGEVRLSWDEPGPARGGGGGNTVEAR